MRKNRNIAIDRIAFERRVQRNGESFNDYLVEIKKLARLADLCRHCMDNRILTKLMSGLQDGETKEELLTKVPAPSLEDAIDLCRAKEAARRSNRELSSRTVKKVHRPLNSSNTWRACYYCKRDRCDGASRQSREKFNKTCDKCRIPHHLQGSVACEKGYRRDDPQSLTWRNRGSTRGSTHSGARGRGATEAEAERSKLEESHRDELPPLRCHYILPKEE